MTRRWYAIRASTRTRHQLDYDHAKDVDSLRPFAITRCGQAIYPEDRTDGDRNIRDCKRCELIEKAASQ